MADEEAQKNGAQWLKIVLIVSAIFAVLIIAAYLRNSYKRDSREAPSSPAINAKG